MAHFQNLNEVSDIDQIGIVSEHKLQIIFKHSTTCPISRIAYEKMQEAYPLQDEQADLYYLPVIEQRPISNYAAEKWSIQHESPQLLIIKNGKVVFHESHLMIKPEAILNYI
jgi:bacillithiol system protein YtxJ